jgi:Cu+-exporting ATPase
MKGKHPCEERRLPTARRMHAKESGAAEMVTDPVCEMQVDETTSTINTEYNGKTFFFCSEECKEVFETDPAPYANKVA